ncbi:MAG: NAD(P)H-dependent glycerol-3-phosphate dehydrogenase [Rhodothermia bacterium]|nr:MAG: NAD(P)H-dependent glycerol-3-phosphate dehydrogenase [Rhodothermia bacterium]
MSTTGSPEKSIAIVGAGSWGTALAVSLASKNIPVRLWARREEAAKQIRDDRHNPTYLPDVVIPESIVVTSHLEEAVEGADFWVFATPSQAVRSVAEQLAEFATAKHLAVSVAKGIENETLLTATGVLHEALPRIPLGNLGVLYGPSHAEEVAVGVPTAVVVSARDLAAAEIMQDVFMTSTFRVYVNPDIVGVEIAGSVKNVLAIATGIVEGIGYGDNTKAALITRGLDEIKRLGMVMGANPSTFSGLAGIGDVVVTCMSKLSRNRYFGEQIGKGKTLSEIEAEMTMVAEGVRTTKSTYKLSRQHDIEMPITEGVYACLFEGKRPDVVIQELMTRTAKREDWLPEMLREDAL